MSVVHNSQELLVRVLPGKILASRGRKENKVTGETKTYNECRIPGTTNGILHTLIRNTKT